MSQNNQHSSISARTHELKTDPEVFAAILSGAKTHEIRANDRGFEVGDLLRLRETVSTGEAMRAGAPLEYTGREIARTVSHVLTGYGLQDGWCILSLANPKPAAVLDLPTIDTAEFRERLRGIAGQIAVHDEPYKRLVGCINRHFAIATLRRTTLVPEGRKVTYVPHRGRKGVTHVTTWGPSDMILPIHTRIIEDVPLYAEPAFVPCQASSGPVQPWVERVKLYKKVDGITCAMLAEIHDWRKLFAVEGEKETDEGSLWPSFDQFMFVYRLAGEYYKDPKAIAQRCDHEIDRSGGLLGLVRLVAGFNARSTVKNDALVTRESALRALEHLELSNSSGRKQEAEEMLVSVTSTSDALGQGDLCARGASGNATGLSLEEDFASLFSWALNVLDTPLPAVSPAALQQFKERSREIGIALEGAPDTDGTLGPIDKEPFAAVAEIAMAQVEAELKPAMDIMCGVTDTPGGKR